MHFTQIGSLPFDDIDQAIDYSFQHSIPFVPDLPAVSSHEFMLEQAKQSEQTPYQQICLEPFIEKSKRFKGIIKNQLPGPLCISQYIDWEFEKAFKIWEMILMDRVEAFKVLDNPFWIFIDEPSFFDHSLDMRVKVFKRLEVIDNVSFAIHYCGDGKVNTQKWPASLALSYDTSLHSNISLVKLIRGISNHDESFRTSDEIITPPCGLWQNSNPSKVLELLKSVSK